MQLEDPQCLCREKNQRALGELLGSQAWGGVTGIRGTGFSVYFKLGSRRGRDASGGKHRDSGFSGVLQAVLGTVGFCGVMG